MVLFLHSPRFLSITYLYLVENASQPWSFLLVGSVLAMMYDELSAATSGLPFVSPVGLLQRCMLLVLVSPRELVIQCYGCLLANGPIRCMRSCSTACLIWTRFNPIVAPLRSILLPSSPDVELSFIGVENFIVYAPHCCSRMLGNEFEVPPMKSFCAATTPRQLGNSLDVWMAETISSHWKHYIQLHCLVHETESRE